MHVIFSYILSYIVEMRSVAEQLVVPPTAPPLAPELGAVTHPSSVAIGVSFSLLLFVARLPIGRHA